MQSVSGSNATLQYCLPSHSGVQSAHCQSHRFLSTMLQSIEIGMKLCFFPSACFFDFFYNLTNPEKLRRNCTTGKLKNLCSNVQVILVVQIP